MAKPAIVLVDDDLNALAALERDVRTRFGADYAVVVRHSPEDALDELRRLVATGYLPALVIADLWMPDMTGTELLTRVRDIDQRAKRLLLIELGDRSSTEPLLQAIALGEIDYYLGKPWGPPEFRLYPMISEFLADWARTGRVEAGWVRVVGDRWSARTHEMRDLLNRNNVPFEFFETESAEGQRLLREAGEDGSRLPVAVMFDGSVLVDPTNAAVAEQLGATTTADDRTYDVAIIGAGPAGLAAAVYATSEGLSAVVVEPEASGGQAGTTSLIRNYLGFPRGVSGAELARRAYEQAQLFGASFVFMNRATGIESHGDERMVRLADGGRIASRSVVIATGAAYRRLEVPGVERLTGAGIYYGASVTEVWPMTGKPVFVVGAANVAGQAAIHLAKYAREVTMIVRGESIAADMSDYLVTEIERRKNIRVRVHTQVVEAYGEQRLMGLVLRHRMSGTTERVKAAGLFVLIGADPKTEWLAGVVQRDAAGYVLTGRDLLRDGGMPEGWTLMRPPLLLETSVPGVFAAGDVRHGAMRRVASAVGEGAAAIMLVHQYLGERAEVGARA